MHMKKKKGVGGGKVAAAETNPPAESKIVLASTTSLFDLPTHVLSVVFESNADIKTFWALTNTCKLMHGLRKMPDLVALRHKLAMKEIPAHKTMLLTKVSDAITKRRIEERVRSTSLNSYHSSDGKVKAMEREEAVMAAEIVVADQAIRLVKSLEIMMTEHRVQKKEILDMRHKLMDAERSMNKMKIKEDAAINISPPASEPATPVPTPAPALGSPPITAGMILEMDSTELLALLGSDTALACKVGEAIRVLKENNALKLGLSGAWIKPLTI